MKRQRTIETGGRVRIVAGAARGRRLVVPKGRQVRPTPDRVREALFSILGERCQDARVADVCSGTGALGLEALSRGASEVVFIEGDRAVAATLSENITRVGLEGTRVEVKDVFVALRLLGLEGETFDVILVDPPYAANLFTPILKAISKNHLLDPKGLAVVEHPSDIEVDVEAGSIRLADRRQYGNVALGFYETIKDP